MTLRSPQPEHMTAYFRCAKYATTLTRAQCAFMRRRADTTPLKGHRTGGVIEVRRCRGCEIGEAHRRKREHADAPTVAPPLVAVSALRKRRPCLTCGGEVRRGRTWFCSAAPPADIKARARDVLATKQ